MLLFCCAAGARWDNIPLCLVLNMPEHLGPDAGYAKNVAAGCCDGRAHVSDVLITLKSSEGCSTPSMAGQIL